MNTRTCWQLGEQVGDASLHGMQRLSGEAMWDADKVRDDVRQYVVDESGDPRAMLILDDTGDLKKVPRTGRTLRRVSGNPSTSNW